MKRFILFFGYILIVAIAAVIAEKKYSPSVIPEKTTGSSSNNNSNNGPVIVFNKITGKAGTLRPYIRKKGFNPDYCFIVDLSIHSGQRRFFIYNLKKDSIEQSGLVTHGSGLSSRSGNVKFSNQPGSNCSSYGRYSIGKSYQGKFGLAYKLHGLDKSNSAAFERFVVLHSHSCVPDEEVYPATICESWGCPTVSPEFLKIAQSYIENSKKRILLEIIK